MICTKSEKDIKIYFIVIGTIIIIFIIILILASFGKLDNITCNKCSPLLNIDICSLLSTELNKSYTILASHIKNCNDNIISLKKPSTTNPSLIHTWPLRIVDTMQLLLSRLVVPISTNLSSSNSDKNIINSLIDSIKPSMYSYQFPVPIPTNTNTTATNVAKSTNAATTIAPTTSAKTTSATITTTYDIYNQTIYIYIGIIDKLKQKLIASLGELKKLQPAPISTLNLLLNEITKKNTDADNLAYKFIAISSKLIKIINNNWDKLYLQNPKLLEDFLDWISPILTIFKIIYYKAHTYTIIVYNYNLRPNSDYIGWLYNPISIKQTDDKKLINDINNWMNTLSQFNKFVSTFDNNLKINTSMLNENVLLEIRTRLNVLLDTNLLSRYIYITDSDRTSLQVVIPNTSTNTDRKILLIKFVSMMVNCIMYMSSYNSDNYDFITYYNSIKTQYTQLNSYFLDAYDYILIPNILNVIGIVLNKMSTIIKI